MSRNLTFSKPMTVVLGKNPYPSMPAFSNAQVLPLNSASDFEAIASLPNSNCPVYLSFDEHHRLLSELVEFFLENRKHTTVLLRISMPSGMRLPKNLLNERVLMLQDIEPEETKLRLTGEPFVAIDSQLVRFRLEQGNNQLTIRPYFELNSEEEIALENLLLNRGFDLNLNPIGSNKRSSSEAICSKTNDGVA